MTIAMISATDQDGSPNSPPNKNSDDDGVLEEGQEPDFPHAELARLDEMIHRQRWVVPVLAKCELEVLLDASIQLCYKGLDTRSEACQRFFRDGLTTSFTKILTDDAVTSWKTEIQKCVMRNCEKLVELIVSKLSQDWFPLLDLLAMVFNPNNKFHAFNCARYPDSVPQHSDEEVFAKPIDSRHARGWLVDLINLFGKLNGFQILLDRFQNGKALSVPVVCAVLKPFSMCYDLLTVPTIAKYFLPIIEIVPSFLENLTDDELKKEAKNEAKNDALSTIIKTIKCLVSRLPAQEETSKNLEIFRLKMILRLLQISSFNGKMNALNEVNKVIGNVSHPSHRHESIEEDEWLTADRMADWIKDNGVLQIVLRDSLHQPQYVEKLEKIIRFVIKQNALSMLDLDDIWAAQHGKHEAIVKNVHDLLAKLAWDFSPEQLDHLFVCFQTSWSQATKKQREKLLELIRRLAEDDKDGVMAHKVLALLWSLAHSEDVPTDIMDQALSAHVKILDFSCSNDRDMQKQEWLDKCVKELVNDEWVIPALKQMREICCSFNESPPTLPQHQRPPSYGNFRHNILSKLQEKHSLVICLADNLNSYMNKVSIMVKANPELDHTQIIPDGRYPHITQVQERLAFLRFVLKDGRLWLCAPQAQQIWRCLAEDALFAVDRESCFKWFSKLMGEEPDLDPDVNTSFFEQNILQLDPALLTEQGMRCFERFFRVVNIREKRILHKRRTYMMESEDLIGIDYIWRVVLCGNDEIAQKAIDLLKETFTNLGPRLQSNLVALHEDFISNCRSRLTAMNDTVSILESDKDSVNKVRQETTRMCRVLKVLYEYIDECDSDFGDERTILPLGRGFRGKHIPVTVRFLIQGRQPDELELWPHENDTLGALRRQFASQILQPVKPTSSTKVEMYLNGDILDPMEDKRLVADLGVKDKSQVLTAKLIQASAMASSPDSSSDSSTGSPPQHFDGPNLAAERCLPGVIMSTQPGCSEFLLRLADLGCSLKLPRLRDSARRLLNLMPADTTKAANLESVCQEAASKGGCDGGVAPKLEEFFFSASPSTVLYNLEVLFTLLMPGSTPFEEKTIRFQYNFMMAGGVRLAIDMLIRNNFLSTADLATKRDAVIFVLRIAKVMFTSIGQAVVLAMSNNMNSPSEMESPSSTGSRSELVGPPMAYIQVLQLALNHIPNSLSDCMVRSAAVTLAHALCETITSTTYVWTQFRTGLTPDMSLVKALLRLTWAGALGQFQLAATSLDEIERVAQKTPHGRIDNEDLVVSNMAIETLSVVLVLHPAALDGLSKEPQFRQMVLDLVLVSEEKSIRTTAMEEFLQMATKCSPSQNTLIVFIGMLFKVLHKHHQAISKEFFQLLCGLVGYLSVAKIVLPGIDRLILAEIDWLKSAKSQIAQSSPADSQITDILLEGHLSVTRELVSLLSSEKKHEIGGNSKGICLIKELIEDFLFPFSKVYLQLEHISVMPAEQAIPVCSSQLTVIAAYDLLVTLCTGCVQNLQILSDMLTNMFYSSNEEPITEWEYLPPVGPRPYRGFVGLKNAGATCYMNSVLQQLYMIRKVREGVLSINGATSEIDEDFSGEDRPEQEPTIEISEDDNVNSNSEVSRKEYHIGVLKQVQAIFGHLACSKLQYYVPRGLWRHFKLQGEPVNLREQHDACEFYNILVEDINEAMKALGEPQMLTKILGGSFSDQKICKTCPHRYSREEAFTVISIDIRFYTNLYDSLEQYVKGDLLEGDNAYLCEKCNKKVDTVKRICLKKLPSTLAIQLKRFDYDWERECSIKFNDYFEFPRELDMEPYTVTGLARNGELIDCDDEDMKNQACSKYKLTGIVVHSGQASGGHYYSYIMHRVKNESKWYKFDDGEVTECKMDDDEEMKNQCFGGEYMGEQVFDNLMKRVSYRRQKRWWNAYLLFYTRLDQEEDEFSSQFNELSLADRPGLIKMPPAIERSIVRQNVRFMHSRSQFSMEYFQFMKKLIISNHSFVIHNPPGRTQEVEDIAVLSTSLASKFLFLVGLHTKKALRGPAVDWYDAIIVHLRSCQASRAWFARNVLFAQQERFLEYLLECPSPEVRLVFSKLIVLLAASSRDDPPQRVPCGPLKNVDLDSRDGYSMSDQLIVSVLLLLNKDVSEHGRHLQQYFNLFHMYASIGDQEKHQLLKLNVVESLIQLAIDEGPGPTIKYQHPDLTRLHQVISILVRSCDASMHCGSSDAHSQKKSPLKNPFGEPSKSGPLMAIQPNVYDLLYEKTQYVKKIIEEANGSDDTMNLLKFCSWENPSFSSNVLSEILWQIAYGYNTSELKPYFELLLQMLFLQDSWQDHRIHNALKEDREGLFETTARTKMNHQKRAYQCIKCMVALFESCHTAKKMLHTNKDFKSKFSSAICWLAEELDRKCYPNTNQQYYNHWPSQSNEISNAFYLERSPSARTTLEKAYELCPEEFNANLKSREVCQGDRELEEPEDLDQQIPEEMETSSISVNQVPSMSSHTTCPSDDNGLHHSVSHRSSTSFQTNSQTRGEPPSPGRHTSGTSIGPPQSHIHSPQDNS